MYYVISNMEGDFSISGYETKDQLLEHIEEHSSYQYYTPELTDLTAEGEAIIIKGSVVMPVPKKVVETFDIE